MKGETLLFLKIEDPKADPIEFSIGDVKVSDVGLGKGRWFTLIQNLNGTYTGKTGIVVAKPSILDKVKKAVTQKPVVAAKAVTPAAPMRQSGASREDRRSVNF